MLRDKQIYKDAAIRLKSRREAKGISVPDLANRLGVSTARYRTWEKIFGPLPQHQYGDAIDRILLDWGEPPPRREAKDSPSPDNLDYEELGCRAKLRRESLGLSRSFVSGYMDMSGSTLQAWEISLPPCRRGSKEEAWENVLQVTPGWLRDPSMFAPDLLKAVIDLTDAEFLSVADEIRAVGAWLARSRVTTRTWGFNELSEQEQRRAIMFADRYGVSGEDKTTLQAIGDRFCLTRERVRQVIDKMTDRARGHQFNLPRLVQLKAAANSPRLWVVADFEAAHCDLLGGVSLADADRFAREILGFSVASISERAFGQAINALHPMIIDLNVQEIVIAVRASSLRMIRSCGAAHVIYVTGMVSEATGKAVSLPDVRRALIAIEGMEWLTEDEDWFWLGPDTANNRALEAVRKVLATASRKVDVEDLHQALCRSRRAYYKSEVRVQPPEIEVSQEVLREILSRVPWLVVIQKNDFLLKEEVSIEAVLNSSELAVVRVIEEHGGAAARQVFNKKFVDTGIFSLPNLQIVLSNSPVIRQLGYGVYGIRGKEFPQNAFSTAHASVTKFSSLIDMTDDGWCEFKFTISEAGLRNGIADIPRSVLRMILPGIYTAEGVASGAFSLGTIQSAPTRTSGLVRLLRKADIYPGESLLFRIHPESRRVRILRAEQLEPDD